MNSLLLKDKYAIVFGGSGAIGAGVAKEFASEGAEVFLVGRTEARLEAVAREINGAGGRAHIGVVDATQTEAVDGYIDAVVRQTGRIDAIFNAVGPSIREYGNAKGIVDMSAEEFMVAMQTVVRPGFVAARSGARHMVKQRSGVIMFVTGSPARPHGPGTTAIGAAFAALENLTRTLAYELSPHGVRVVCVRTSAMPDTRTIQETSEVIAKQVGISAEQAIAQLASMTLLKQSPRVLDTARAAVLVASDRTRMMTGTVFNTTAGVCPD